MNIKQRLLLGLISLSLIGGSYISLEKLNTVNLQDDLCFVDDVFEEEPTKITKKTNNPSIKTLKETKFAISEIGSFRLEEERTGIRFKAQVPETEVDSSTFGMGIIPLDYVSKYSLDEDYVDYLSVLEGQSVNYINLECQPIKVDEQYIIQGSIVNIRTYNKDRKFVAFAYQCVEGEYTYSLNSCSEEFAISYYDAATALREDNEVYMNLPSNLQNILNDALSTKQTLRTAVFADVQLCYKTAGTGYSANLGSTANSPLALRNHLKLCKEKNAEVLFMVGDICNNAVEKYYEYYQEIFESVYGTDKSTYPEIIWSMGNHEWWDLNENDTANAVKLFNKYANIDSKYLVKKSSVPYSLDSTVTLPNYYKVVKGVPFLVISGEGSSGKIGSTLSNEITTWLAEIKNLPSVKAGGPIYVAHHTALSTTQTHGNGAGNHCDVIENILKDTPQAIVFTGDTHFSGVNERAINQVNFTNINIGSSSYSRMDPQSATMTGSDHFYNMKDGGSKQSDIMVGNSQYLYEYTPTIHVMDTLGNFDTKINRYFSSEDVNNAKHLGKEWLIKSNITKDSFAYTNSRFKNSESAISLYGKEGVSWSNEAEVKFGVDNGTMTVRFEDVEEFHFVEHYKIEVTSNLSNKKTYDCVGTYYKYNDQKENNYFVLKDLPLGSSYSVKVTAYDFFDNPSLNFLESSTDDSLSCIDKMDYQATLAYTDISTRVNVNEVAITGSNTSLEVFYKGIQEYRYGATVTRLFHSNESIVSCKDFVSMDPNKTKPIVKMKVKNLKEADIVIGLTVVTSTGTWKTDFGAEYHETVKKSDGWLELSWNLYNYFGIEALSQLQQVGIKVKSKTVDTVNGYEMNFLIDDLDIVAGSDEPLPPRGTAIKASTDYTISLGGSISTSNGVVVIDVMYTNEGKPAIMLFNSSSWDHYFGYFDLTQTTNTGDYGGLTVTTTSDGYRRFTFNMGLVSKLSGTRPSTITHLYVRANWSTMTGYIDVNPSI